jgi:hypothetical protein
MRGALVLLLALPVGACSSSLAPSKSDAGRDAAGSVDRQDGSGGCSPLDISMWPASQCPATWAEVVAYPQCAEQTQYQKVRFDCGAYQTITQYGLDFQVSCSYETASGKLVAVSYDAVAGAQCWGPPAGLPAYCSGAIASTICPVDAGIPSDAAAANCLSKNGLPYLTWNQPCPGDGGTLCYANCTVTGNGKYVGCVTDDPTGTQCHASCSECP